MEFKRVNIGPQVRAIEQYGVVTPHPDPLKGLYLPEHARQVLFDQKPHLYAVVSPLTEMVVNSSIKEGLPATVGSLDDLYLQTNERLSRAVSNQWDSLASLHASFGVTMPMVSAYSRLEEIMAFSREVVQNPYPPQRNSQVMMEGGTMVAAAQMTRLLKVIPEVRKREHVSTNEEAIRATANNSFGVVTDIAMRHQASFSALFKFLRLGGFDEDGGFYDFNGVQLWDFDPYCFELVQSERGDRLKIKDEVKNEARKLIPNIRANYPDSDYEVGCPAMYSGAMRKLWCQILTSVSDI